MSQTKHNWTALKTEFVTGDINHIIEFARLKGIPHNTIIKHQKGWLDAQAKHRQNTHNKIEEKVSEKRALSAEKKIAEMSSAMMGAFDQWRKIAEKLKGLEKDVETGNSQKNLENARQAHNAALKVLPELMKSLQLLEGGATSRTDAVIRGKRTKDMSYEEIEELEREIAREVLEEEQKEKEEEAEEKNEEREAGD